MPESLVTLTNLIDIQLSSNQFDGDLPLGFDRMASLKTLNLFDNNFTGDTTQLSQIEELAIDNNNFNDTNSAIASSGGK